MAGGPGWRVSGQRHNAAGMSISPLFAWLKLDIDIVGQLGPSDGGELQANVRQVGSSLGPRGDWPV